MWLHVYQSSSASSIEAAAEWSASTPSVQVTSSRPPQRSQLRRLTSSPSALTGCQAGAGARAAVWLLLAVLAAANTMLLTPTTPMQHNFLNLLTHWLLRISNANLVAQELQSTTFSKYTVPCTTLVSLYVPAVTGSVTIPLNT